MNNHSKHFFKKESIGTEDVAIHNGHLIMLLCRAK
jgi:hypothetical protein